MFNEEKHLVIREETRKLMAAGEIREIQYPDWLVNVVLVKKKRLRTAMEVKTHLKGLQEACSKL